MPDAADHLTNDRAITIPTLTIDNEGRSVFAKSTYMLGERNGLFISEQIGAMNFRLRESKPGYKTDWHVAGDPTLIIILEGQLRITMRDGLQYDFFAGEQFVAADYLRGGEIFDTALHGHKAKVMGQETLRAVHIKLAKR